ncbi:MAG: RNA polymerase-binding transcription factor DksA [Rhodomicrobium sp.]|nr:MAG: RNA polymerase-binding transcription factor DksA [Rhodomicrobium sp.]
MATKKNSTKVKRENGRVVLPEGYQPSADEPFMNEVQLEYFRQKLTNWKAEILEATKETIQHLQDESEKHPDITDRATSESERALELRTRDRQRKLISKIDEALYRIDQGEYGYCEESGEPIGVARLDARPIATLSLEAQERHEKRERVFRDS